MILEIEYKKRKGTEMKIRIVLFVLSVAALAAFGLFTQAKAGQNIIINNYQTQSAPYPTRFCWGLIGCLVAHAMDESERQAAQGPHACNVWNGRRYVPGTCAP